ncbi:tetratricopeptide repeat protein [Nonomuraea longispora]|uniref:tetratricopeptide repeat protein n=1 Tax=Nonomuraea longispora TaxID=1848320 RepID=UPI003CCC5429
MEGVTLTNLGNVHQKAGRLAHAVKAHTESLAIAEEVGNTIGVAAALGHLAETDRRARPGEGSAAADAPPSSTGST